MPKKWLSADYHTKQRLQYLLFPEGITYKRENDQSRTSRINSVFLYLAHLKRIILNEKSEMTAFGLDHFALTCSVAGTGEISNFLEDVRSLSNAENIIKGTGN